jgi:hypothetical protein
VWHFTLRSSNTWIFTPRRTRSFDPTPSNTWYRGIRDFSVWHQAVHDTEGYVTFQSDTKQYMIPRDTWLFSLTPSSTWYRGIRDYSVWHQAVHDTEGYVTLQSDTKQYMMPRDTWLFSLTLSLRLRATWHLTLTPSGMYGWHKGEYAIPLRDQGEREVSIWEHVVRSWKVLTTLQNTPFWFKAVRLLGTSMYVNVSKSDEMCLYTNTIWVASMSPS